jgi:hypothetical protein
MSTTRIGLAGVLLAAALTAGCETLFGDDDNGAPAPAPGPSADVRGTVESVDTQARTLTVATDTSYRSNLRNEARTVLGYDGSTVVEYQGRQHRPEDLEAGDRIEASTERVGDRLMARRVVVVSDVSGGDGVGSPTADLRDFDATVRWVDTTNRTIELEPRGGGNAVIAGYDSRTTVEYGGRSHRPEDLERGDDVRVTTRQSSGRIMAESIVVTRDTSGTAGAPGPGQLRGTVRSVDTAGRAIELEGVSWAQGFDAGAGGSTTIVTYDTNTIVEYQGQRYGVSHLERGDLVDVEVSGDGGSRPLARRIIVARSA